MDGDAAEEKASSKLIALISCGVAVGFSAESVDCLIPEFDADIEKSRFHKYFSFASGSYSFADRYVGILHAVRNMKSSRKA